MSRGATLLVSFLAGFVALSYEILWYRVFAFASGSAAPTFSLLLGSYLVGIAIGAHVAARLCERLPERSPRQLAWLADYVVAANSLAFLFIPCVARLMTVFPYWSTWIYLACPAAALLGTIYPLTNHLAIAPDARVGRWISYLYVANILGSTAGSLGTGFVLLEHWTMMQVASLVAVVGVASAVIPVMALPDAGSRVRRLVAVSAVALGVVVVSKPLYQHTYERLRLQDAYNSARPFREVIENRAGVIAVRDDGTVYGGGIYDGAFNTSLKPDHNNVIRTFAGLSLHPAPREILLVGLSTGSWAQILAHHPAAESVTCIEINPGYLRLFETHPSSRSLLSNPKVHIEIDDGRRWLVRNATRRFDLILVHIWNWPSNASNLLSREALELLRKHLRPEGILFYSSTGSDRVQRTGATTFPHALRVWNWMAVRDTPIRYDRRTLEALIDGYRIEGARVIADDESGRRWLAGRLSYLEHEMETRESILERTRGLALVTEDNMGTEWTGYPLRVP